MMQHTLCQTTLYCKFNWCSYKTCTVLWSTTNSTSGGRVLWL